MFQLIDNSGKVIAKSTSDKLTDGLLSSLNRRSEAGIKNSGRWNTELSNLVASLQAKDKKFNPSNCKIVLQEEGYKLELSYDDFMSVISSNVQFTRLIVKTPTGGKRGRKAQTIEFEINQVGSPVKRGRKPKETVS